MVNDKENIKSYIRALSREMIDEEGGNVTGGDGAYSTPKAFSPIKKKFHEVLDKAILKMMNEVSYGQFKKQSQTRTKPEQLHKAVREVKRKLQEVNKLIDYTSRMRDELSESEDGLRHWKNTEKAVTQISEMSKQILSKVKNLYK